MSGLLERIARRRHALPGKQLPQDERGDVAPGPAVPPLEPPLDQSLTSNGNGTAAAPTVTPAVTPPLELEAGEPQAEPPEAAPPPEPRLDFRQRGRLQRRARFLRRLRELQLRDLGGLVVELHRFGRERPDLVAAKVAVAAETADELRSLERALLDGRALRELREAGIGGACEECGAVHGSADRFCAACGHRLGSPGKEPER